MLCVCVCLRLSGGLCIKQNLCKSVFERETNSDSVVQLTLISDIAYLF